MKAPHFFNILSNYLLPFLKGLQIKIKLGFPSGSVGKEFTSNAGDRRDVGLILGSGKPPGGGNGNAFQYSSLGNPTDRGAWWAMVHGVAKSRTRLK